MRIKYKGRTWALESGRGGLDFGAVTGSSLYVHHMKLVSQNHKSLSLFPHLRNGSKKNTYFAELVILNCVRA